MPSISHKKHIPYPFLLINSLLKHLKIKSLSANCYRKLLNEMRRNIFINTNKLKPLFIKNGIFISPHIRSGKFRNFLNSLDKQLEFKLKKSPHFFSLTKYLVSSNFDKKINFSFKYQELKGMPLGKIIKSLIDNSFVYGIGYDNFWMHVFDLLEIKYYVFFRGRLTKNQREIHYNSINISFFNTKKKKTYI